MKKRLVIGMSEVHRAVERGDAKCVIISPQMENSGGYNVEAFYSYL